MNKNLTITIIVSSVLIAGSFIFLGTQIANVNWAALKSVKQTGRQVRTVKIDPSDLQRKIDESVKKTAEAAKSRPNSPPTTIVTTITEDNLADLIINEILESPDYNLINFEDDDAFMGSVDAPVTLIEWSDYECPFCKQFFKETLPLIKEKYIDTGKVRFVYRDYPLEFHRNAYPAAMAAECAREQGGNEMYFKYHDLIFENQSNLNEDSLRQLAINLELNTDKFNECLDSGKYKDEVTKDFVDGLSVGVSGTPGFLLNGRLISGAQPFSVFEEFIEAELN